MTMLLILHTVFGLVALLVMAAVGLVHHHRAAQRGRAELRAPRVTSAVAAVAEKIDPGDAPPLGVLSTPEKSRRISARFEAAEQKVRRGARAITSLSRSNS